MATTLQPAETPITSASLATELHAILTGVASVPHYDRTFLRITGSDATRWLNGMVTNNIQDLQPGEGNYNFLLSAQGRILGDCTIYRSPAPNFFLLATSVDQAQTIQQHLDKFIIMDDVELWPFTETGLLLLGPGTLEALQKLGLQNAGPLSMADVACDLCRKAMITTPSFAMVPQVEIYPPGDMEDCSPKLQTVAGAIPVSPAALEAFRILSGTPRYGVDIRNTATAHDLPQETAQTRALHFSKGCYLGQEIVERIHSRGNVHRTFSGFELTGALPAPGTTLTAEGKLAGELTSVAAIQLATPVQLALGYVRREALERKLPLEYPGGTATPIALPYAIP